MREEKARRGRGRGRGHTSSIDASLFSNGIGEGRKGEKDCNTKISKGGNQGGYQGIDEGSDLSGRKEEGANEWKGNNAGDNSFEEASKDTIKEKTNETTQGEDKLSKVDNKGKDGANDLGHCTNHTFVNPDGHRWGPLVLFSNLNQD